MPFSYDQLEDGVVSYLAPKLTNADVWAMPETDGDWKDVVDKPIVYVFYSESSFQPSSSTNLVKQDEKPTITCNVRAKKRRGSGGVNETIALLKKYLQGYQIPSTGCNRLQLQSIKLEERDTDKMVWSYSVAFSTSKQQVQDIDETETSTNLLQDVQFDPSVQLP